MELFDILCLLWHAGRLRQSICQEQPITFRAKVVPRQPKLQTQKQALDSRKKHEDGAEGSLGKDWPRSH